MTDEPLLDADDIQGHILPGYGPGDVSLLALSVASAEAARAVLHAVVPHVTTMRAAMGYRGRRKAVHRGLTALLFDPIHVHIALTRRGLDRVGFEQRGLDPAFDAGMTGLSTGDTRAATLPDGQPEPAHPSNWQVGGRNKPFDVLVIFVGSSELSPPLSTQMAPLRSQLVGLAGVDIVYEEHGADLRDSREHFGFQDGISSPGVYGEYMQRGVRHRVTTRYGVPTQNGRDFGKPGQPLLWPGRFVVGLPRSRDDTPVAVHPIWRNGSFLVFRRLAQDVAAFYGDTDAMAAAVAAQVPGVTGAQLRSLIVGRRPNGQPLMRPGDGPDPALAINHFLYQTSAPALTLCDGTQISAASRDLDGKTCPFWAHVRKVNPRDGVNDLPIDAPDLQPLRRGVPFGPAFEYDNPAAETNADARGLLFLAYQADIHEHFENLNSHWMNQFDQPAGGGHDLLVGLALDATGRLGPRRAIWPASETELVTPRTWVTPTGGAYLFAPSLLALEALANGRVT